MEGKILIALLLCWCAAAQYAYAQVNCSAAGRFADPADPACRNYTLCVRDPAADNSFLAYHYSCPAPAAFSPATRQCSAAHACPSAAAPANATACTSEGFFADANSTDCSSYIQCVAAGGSFTQTVLACPAGTRYDPATTLCDPSYVCSAPVSCAAGGRVPDPADPSCQQYYLCAANATSGALAAYQFRCPAASAFSPATGHCTTAYSCPTA